MFGPTPTAGLSLGSAAGAVRVARAAARGAGPPIRGQVIRRGAVGFAAAAHVYNELYDGVLPNVVARPVDAMDVRTAVRWGVANGVPLRARSGGHSYAGYSTLSGGMVLDLRNLRGVSVDTRKHTATIGAGAQLVDVYAALAGRGVTIPAGSCPSVGIAGHALGGAGFSVNWPWSQAAEALAAWQAWGPHARPEVTTVFHLSA
ncbi:MAG TPA: FAD-dependent oxidoreductase, partial [Solirubrobacteraceae bacterium]|nr:FAD-dependent oxidoreductase [Solirubrobacteraceae bacterium]